MNLLAAAHQGYIYQDILGAFFIAQELSQGRGETLFHFDQKKTPTGKPDKFDDIVIYHQGAKSFIQVKYSNEQNNHTLTKDDFSSSANYDLALFDLFETWNILRTTGSNWRICLAWLKPISGDPLWTVFNKLPDDTSLLPGTTCYQFNCDALWPEGEEVLTSWRALKTKSKSIERSLFKQFLESLIIEVSCPKSSLLQDFSQGLEQLLSRAIQSIGVGIYPNDHISVRDAAERICSLVRSLRATHNSSPISCNEVAERVNIKQDYGSVEQHFPIDESVFVESNARIDQVVAALEHYRTVVLTAEPGAGKSWFISNLENHLQGSIRVVKHYCYISLEDHRALDRITVNVLYGSLISQILNHFDGLGGYLIRRYASNLEQLNILLNKIPIKTLLIIDGIDHIWRIYQKNRGGITEDETTILKALTQLECSNPNVSILVVSQPIVQLEELISFHNLSLAKLSEEFVQELLSKNAVSNYEVGGVKLSSVIHTKSNGNALYDKYIIDQAVNNKSHTSFDWINELPSYNYSLTSYYQYLYDQIQGNFQVPCALCGADFSLTESELNEITRLGNLISTQLKSLRPVLNYSLASGYSIYHESFKRFVIDSIKAADASIEHLVYQPIIEWLEKHSFFESLKAYNNLLKLYFEVNDYESIVRLVTIDFINLSLYNSQPIYSIEQNHKIQRASLKYINSFALMLILFEQSKIIYQVRHLGDETLITYLRAVEALHGEEVMSRVLWDGENLLINTKDAFKLLVQQVYEGRQNIHWAILPKRGSIPFELLPFRVVQLLHTKKYLLLDNLIKNIFEKYEPKYVFELLNEIKWWCLHFSGDCLEYTPYLKSFLSSHTSEYKNLDQIVEFIIRSEKVGLDDTWNMFIYEFVELVKFADRNEVHLAIERLKDFNWFRNWLIYLILITDISSREYTEEQVVEAFSYLVRDLEPFKGEPRAAYLFTELPYIKRSFYQGLILCGSNGLLLRKCCDLLEKVTNLSASIQRSFSGPLLDEEYLGLIAKFLPSDYVVEKYREYFAQLSSNRVYSNIAEISFEFARVLTQFGINEEAVLKYRAGVEALTAYGYRKDRSLSEVLYSIVPYHLAYGSISIDWFYSVYRMALAVVTHTDGKSTSRYPIEWFNEFIKVFPDEALKFLACETLENEQSHWYQENEFFDMLEDYPDLFNPTQWFLMCRSIPFASSEKIISYGLKIFDFIEEPLQDSFHRWLQTLPFKKKVDGYLKFSEEITVEFERRFGIRLEARKEKEENVESSRDWVGESTLSFSVKSIDELLAYLEIQPILEEHSNMFLQFLNSLENWEDKKLIIRETARSISYKRDMGEWLSNLLEHGSDEWVYMNVCLFVYVLDGWLEGLSYQQYIKRAYEVDPVSTLKYTQENLGFLLSEESLPDHISGNLINALSALNVDESIVSELLQTTYELLSRRLPHLPNSGQNEEVYKGLATFSRDEIVVALLIARLKTLTTEKTQGVIWSLTYLARSNPELLINPYKWAFENHAKFLPIHRALLLQILIENVNPEFIPDDLIGVLVNIYPTGYFLEDQYIRSFVNYNLELDESSAKSIILHEAPADEGFLPYVHIKYRTLKKYCGPLAGTYKAYEYKRDEISRNYDSYYIRSEKVMTPIVPLANACYEIVNNQYYKELKELTKEISLDFTCNLPFFLPEILIQIGSLCRRPKNLPSPGSFPTFEIRQKQDFIADDEWILLASREQEIIGDSHKEKEIRYASLLLTNVESPTPQKEYYSQYLFRAFLYDEREYERDLKNMPICTLEVNDTLEYLRIVFVSPFVIKELGLHIDFEIHNGFQAVNEDNEVIIKLISWKEQYWGSIDDGTEIAKLGGSAVVIKRDYFDKMLSVIEGKSYFILRQSDKEMNI